MPELPEVEVTRRGLLEQLSGRTVVDVGWSGHRLRSAIPGNLLCAHIRGQRIRTIDRRAKYLLVRTTSGAVLLIHLGMSGKLGLLERNMPRHRHDHLFLALDDGRELRFNDSRRFGALAVWPAAEAEEREKALSCREGIEPFGEDFTARTLHTLAAKRRIAIKTLLMNSRLIAGIGNIYANETLFAARVHPLTPANQISIQRWQRIVREARRILHQAIDAGGSTIADFLGASGHPGYFQLHFAVYGRKGQPCPRCARAIDKTVVAGRATYFCPCCQPPPAGGTRV